MINGSCSFTIPTDRRTDQQVVAWEKKMESNTRNLH